MPSASPKSRASAKKAPAPVVADERTLARFGRDVQSVMRRYRQREAAFEEVVSERDRVIRSAMEAGVPRAELAEQTDLSVARLDQIRAGRR